MVKGNIISLTNANTQGRFNKFVPVTYYIPLNTNKIF